MAPRFQAPKYVPILKFEYGFIVFWKDKVMKYQYQLMKCNYLYLIKMWNYLQFY